MSWCVRQSISILKRRLKSNSNFQPKLHSIQTFLRWNNDGKVMVWSNLCHAFSWSRLSCSTQIKNEPLNHSPSLECISCLVKSMAVIYALYLNCIDLYIGVGSSRVHIVRICKHKLARCATNSKTVLLFQFSIPRKCLTLWNVRDANEPDNMRCILKWTLHEANIVIQPSEKSIGSKRKKILIIIVGISSYSVGFFFSSRNI